MLGEISTVIALIGLGAFFIYCAHLSYIKDWKTGAYISIIISAFFIIMALPATRNFMRATAWSVFVTGLESTGQGLIRLNKTIDDIRKGMEIEEENRKAHQDELNKIQKKTMEMHSSLQETQQKIENQQKEISDINQLIKTIFEKGKSVIIDTSVDNDNIVIIEHDKNQVSIYVLLPEIPIYQTLQVQYHIYLQQKNTYWMNKNLVSIRWGQSEESLRKKSFSFTYIPDPTKSEKFSKLEKIGSRAYVDGQPQPYPFVEIDPVVLKFRKEKKKGDIVFSSETIKAADEDIKEEQ